MNNTHHGINVQIINSLSGKTQEQLLSCAADLESIAAGIRDYVTIMVVLKTATLKTP